MFNNMTTTRMDQKATFFSVVATVQRYIINIRALHGTAVSTAVMMFFFPVISSQPTPHGEMAPLPTLYAPRRSKGIDVCI